MSDLPFLPFLSMFQDPLHCKFHYCWPQWWPRADYICKNRVEKQVNIRLFTEWLLQTHLHMVSTSMPENPKALSPSTQTTRRPLSPLFLSRVAAAIANPRPTPIVPNVPASNLTGYDETHWWYHVFPSQKPGFGSSEPHRSPTCASLLLLHSCECTTHLSRIWGD